MNSPPIYEMYGAVHSRSLKYTADSTSAVGGWGHGRVFQQSLLTGSQKLYEIGKKITDLEKDRDAGKPGAQERLKSFRAERILYADTVIQVGFHYSTPPMLIYNSSSRELRRVLRKWAADEALIQARNHDERRTQRREA